MDVCSGTSFWGYAPWQRFSSSYGRRSLSAQAQNVHTCHSVSALGYGTKPTHPFMKWMTLQSTGLVSVNVASMHPHILPPRPVTPKRAFVCVVVVVVGGGGGGAGKR